MSPNWSFKALAEPTARKYRVVFAGGKKQMTFLTENAADKFAASKGGTVEPIVPRQFTLQRAR